MAPAAKDQYPVLRVPQARDTGFLFIKITQRWRCSLIARRLVANRYTSRLMLSGCGRFPILRLVQTLAHQLLHLPRRFTRVTVQIQLHRQHQVMFLKTQRVQIILTRVSVQVQHHRHCQVMLLVPHRVPFQVQLLWHRHVMLIAPLKFHIQVHLHRLYEVLFLRQPKVFI